MSVPPSLYAETLRREHRALRLSDPTMDFVQRNTHIVERVWPLVPTEVREERKRERAIAKAAFVAAGGVLPKRSARPPSGSRRTVYTTFLAVAARDDREAVARGEARPVLTASFNEVSLLRSAQWRALSPEQRDRFVLLNVEDRKSAEARSADRSALRALRTSAAARLAEERSARSAERRVVSARRRLAVEQSKVDAALKTVQAARGLPRS